MFLKNKEKARILLTGYGPFKDAKENITEKIINEIEKDWNSNRATLKTLVMPVEWVKAKKLLESALSDLKPHIAVSMGHALSYKSITLEARYFNQTDKRDNRGNFYYKNIRLNGKHSYRSNMPLEELKSYLTRNGVPASIHDGVNGMTYLCNFAGYNVAYLCSKDPSRKTYHLFVHVPSPEDLDFEISLKGIRLIIDFVINLVNSH